MFSKFQPFLYTCLLSFFFCLLSSSWATIIHVPADTTSIQGGIHLAGNGDTVLVDDGLYYENINFKGKAITVASQFIMGGDTNHISNTIIDGSQPSHPDSGSVVYIVPGENSIAVLEGFTITGGTGTISDYFLDSTSYAGSGILVDSSYCIIKNNIIAFNSLIHTGFDAIGSGLGIYRSRGIIENNKIRFNSINVPNNWGGAAGICIWGGSITVKNNFIINNSIIHNWGAGGGVIIYLPYNSDSVQFIDNTIQRNTCNSSQFVGGGGLAILYCRGEVFVSNNLISHNESHGGPQHIYGEGGGIYIENSNPIVSNNIITHNRSGHAGGIAVCYYPEYEPQPCKPLIINNTISKNAARENGGGICSYGEHAHPTIINTILWGDTAAGHPNEIYNFLSGRMSIMYSNIEGAWPGTGNINMPPCFADELCHLSDSSGCIGFGRRSITIGNNTHFAPSTDFDGDPRPSAIDTLVDIGADESPYGAWAQPRFSVINNHQSYIHPSQDSLRIGVQILNPHQQSIALSTRITTDQGALWDEIPLFDDGLHGDSAAGDLFYGNIIPPVMVEEFFCFSHKIVYNPNQNFLVFLEEQRVTSAGPVIWEACQVYPPTANRFPLRLRLRNLGQITAAEAVTVEIIPKDSWVIGVMWNNQPFGMVLAGDTATHQSPYYVDIDPSGYPGYFTFDVIISSNGYPYWYQQDFTVDLENETDNIPLFFALYQNYPNPFNPTTVIRWQLPVGSEVKLEVYNLRGQKVKILLSASLLSGFHSVEFDASDLASGIYFYHLKAGEHVACRKMILLK